MRESNTKFSLSHMNLKLVNLFTSALFFHSLHIVVLGLPLALITLSRPSLTARLTIANRFFYHSAPACLWNNLPSHLRQVVHHITPSPFSNSPVSNLSTSLFLKKLKTHISLFLFSLVCITANEYISHGLYSPRLSLDWYLRYWPSFVFSSHTHFAIIHRHII